ncbi:conserved Plasmodium protein, unknown function [Plasmodium sp. gorilla clade G1]|nr:conserved Plasmodium protein, unknown function [Plasmodium sp. gorilla clade G1]
MENKIMLNINVLMKKFLTEEKEYIKFMNKEKNDIIVFEKENFYIYTNVLCGIESRKKEKYNVGDIYLFLCLAKSNYTFSYINSIGYKYISILERNKIIKTIEENQEDTDEIKINCYIYDQEKNINLNKYINTHNDYLINIDLFDKLDDVEMESDILFTQKNYNNDIYDKFNQDKQNNDEYISNINDKIIEKKNINEDTHNYTDENLISFDYTKKLFDINKINESFIIHMKNDDIFFCTSLYNKYKMRKSSKKKINKLKKRKYNFIQDDVCSTIYDEMVYFNNNEINTIIEGNNNVNNNFDFIKVEHNMERIMNKTNYDLYNDNQKNNMDDHTYNNDLYYYNDNNVSDENEKKIKTYNLVKHYYENNVFKNIFFQNMNLYSLIKNIYLTNISNEEYIDKSTHFIIQNFYNNFIYYIENYDKYVLMSNEHRQEQIKNIKNNNTNGQEKDIINDEYYFNDEYVDKNKLEVLLSSFNENYVDINEIYKDNISPSLENYKDMYINNNNNNNNSNNMDVIPLLIRRKRKYHNLSFDDKYSLQYLKIFNDHDKLIFFNNMISKYIYAISDKHFYERNKKTINFVHNFLYQYNVSLNDIKEYYNIILPQKMCLAPQKISYENEGHKSDNEFDDNDDDNMFEICKDQNVDLNNDNYVDDVINRNIKRYNKKKIAKNKYLQINSCDLNNSSIYHTLQLDNNIKDNNFELIKSVSVKEVNVKDVHDNLGNNSVDFSRIHNYFKEELLNKNNIKNVFINGIKKNIIVDDQSKMDDKKKIKKKNYKWIDEIHLVYKKRPIIIIEKNQIITNSDNKSIIDNTRKPIINKNNVKSFLLHNKLLTTNNDDILQNDKNKQNVFHSTSLIYKMFNKSIKFLFVEINHIKKFTQNDWKCVIAVILNSKESIKYIFKYYPYQITTTLFYPFKNFLFIYNDDIIPHELLSQSNMEIIKLNRDHRNDDHLAVQKFWKKIEHFILQKRDSNFYIPKKNN